MQSASGRGRSAARGGGLAYKYTDSPRGAGRQGWGCTDKPRQFKKCTDSESGEGCTDSDGVVVGRCSAFCPPNELKLRVRERLLSKYEVGGGGLRPVKEYSRPAAGQASPSSDIVRTPDTLLDCVKYLVMDVLMPRVMVKEEQLDLYDFVFDRLRAVRQDLVVQGVMDNTSMVILSICVRIHLLFGHLLANHPSFSEHINTSHQLDCVKSCLLIPSTHHTNMMESVYLLSNMDSPSAMSWAISQPKLSQQLKLSLAIAHAYEQGNCVRFYRLVSTLPLILLLASAKYCQLMSEHALSVYTKGYKAKNARYPLSHMATLLWLPPSSLSCMLLSKGILVQDEFIWWSASLDDKDTSESTETKSCHHEQICLKVMLLKDQLDLLLLGEREIDQLTEVTIEALSLGVFGV